MTRTPNDDRSDTMNPNNPAYEADQANRYGHDDSSDDDPRDSPSEPPRARPRRDTRFGPDPHPILGMRSNRLPALSCNFQQTHVPEVAPWSESIAAAFATDASEARDRVVAEDELMRVAEWMLEEVRAIIVRQGTGCSFEKEGTGVLTLRLGDRGVVVRRHLSAVTIGFLGRAPQAFLFSRLRWRQARAVRSDGRYVYEGSRYEERGWNEWQWRAHDSNLERLAAETAAYIRAHVHYGTPEAADPTAVLMAAVKMLAPSR